MTGSGDRRLREIYVVALDGSDRFSEFIWLHALDLVDEEPRVHFWCALEPGGADRSAELTIGRCPRPFVDGIEVIFDHLEDAGRGRLRDDWAILLVAQDARALESEQFIRAGRNFLENFETENLRPHVLAAVRRTRSLEEEIGTRLQGFVDMTIVMEQGSDANEQLRMVIDLARENPEVFRPDGVRNPNGRWLWLQERRSSGSAAPPRVRRLRDFIGSTLGALREDEQVKMAQNRLEDGVRNRLHQIQGFLEANPPAHAARPFAGASPTTGSRAEGHHMAEEAEAAFVSYLAAENIALHEQLDEARERRGRELKDKRDDFALSPLQFDPGVASPMRGAVAAQIKLVAETREACVRRARERRNEIASVLGAKNGELSPRQKSAVGSAVEKLRAAARQMPPSPGFVLSIAAIPFLYLALLGGAGFQSTLRWASVNQPPNLQDLRQAGYVVAGCLAIFMVLVALILMRRIRKARMVFEATRVQTISEIQAVANLAAKDVVAMEEYELLRGGAVLLQDLREALSRTDAARIDEVTREIEKLLDIDLASPRDGGARGLLGNGLPPEEWVRDLIRQWRGTQTTSPGGDWHLHVESATRAQKYNEKMLDGDGIISQAISFPSSWRADDTTLYATPLKPLSSAEASS